MEIQKTLKRLESKENFDSLLAQYQPCFTEIDGFIEDLRLDNLNTEPALLSAQTKLTGLYGSLITVFKMMTAIKINMEAKMFVSMEEDYIRNNPGQKPLSAAKLEKMTTVEVGEYRTLRNVFEGYVLAAEKAIFTCQSNAKTLKNERIFNAVDQERYK